MVDLELAIVRLYSLLPTGAGTQQVEEIYVRK